jgi:hypothetical protein
MKSAITAALLSILAFNSYAQESQKNVNEEPLVIYSSQGRIEIKNPSTCTQHRSDKGSIAITCENQCKQTTDSKDGKVSIQC